MSWKNTNMNSLFPSHQQGVYAGVGWKSSVSVSCQVLPVRIRTSVLCSPHYNMQPPLVYLNNKQFPLFLLNSCGTLSVSHTFLAIPTHPSLMLFMNWINKSSLFIFTQFIKCSQRQDNARTFQLTLELPIVDSISFHARLTSRTLYLIFSST